MTTPLCTQVTVLDSIFIQFSPCRDLRLLPVFPVQTPAPILPSADVYVIFYPETLGSQSLDDFYLPSAVVFVSSSIHHHYHWPGSRFSSLYLRRWPNDSHSSIRSRFFSTKLSSNRFTTPRHSGFTASSFWFPRGRADRVWWSPCLISTGSSRFPPSPWRRPSLSEERSGRGTCWLRWTSPTRLSTFQSTVPLGNISASRQWGTFSSFGLFHLAYHQFRGPFHGLCPKWNWNYVVMACNFFSTSTTGSWWLLLPTMLHAGLTTCSPSVKTWGFSSTYRSQICSHLRIWFSWDIIFSLFLGRCSLLPSALFGSSSRLVFSWQRTARPPTTSKSSWVSWWPPRRWCLWVISTCANSSMPSDLSRTPLPILHRSGFPWCLQPNWNSCGGEPPLIYFGVPPCVPWFRTSTCSPMPPARVGEPITSGPWDHTWRLAHISAQELEAVSPPYVIGGGSSRTLLC